MNALAAIQNFTAASILVGVLLLLRTANIPRDRRHQQFALPGVAIVFALAAAVVLYRFNAWFDGLLSWLFGLLPFLSSLYQTRWLYVIENVALVTVFLAIKFAYRLVATRMFTGERFTGSIIVEHFYEYDVASGRWNVKSRLSQVRLLYRVLFWVSLVITGVLVWAMNMNPSAPAFSAIAFPALAVLVLGEVLYALDGLTREESGNLLLSEDDLSRRIVNYAALREVFRNTFGDRIADEGVDLSNPYSLGTYQALSDFVIAGDNTEQLFGKFFERAKLSGLALDENLMHASLGVLRGHSTLINTPFYSDLAPYVALPSYMRLLSGSKMLVVVGRDSSAQDVATWFEGALDDVSGVPELWNVGVMRPEGSVDLDVGVLRLADLHNLRLLGEYDEFFREVETVVLMEPSRMLATGQLGLSVVVSRLNIQDPPVFVALDHNHDGLVDALSHLLKVNLTDVVATGQPLGASSQMVWNASGSNLAAQIIPGVARYLGVGTEITAVALKYHVSEVEWVGGDKFPVTDMSWIAGQYYGKINAFAEMELSQRAFKSSLIPRPNPLGLKRTQHRFLIVEDELSNVYESIRLYGSRSTESGFINLISEDYLLRDYMIGNRSLFSADAKAIPSFVPDYARTKRNTVLRLIVMLAAFEIPESALLRELELVGCIPPEMDEEDADFLEPPVITMLRELIARYLDVTGVQFDRIQRRGGGMADVSERRFRIMPGTCLDPVIEALGSAYFLVEDEAEGRDFIGGCLHNHVQQTVLPGQFITVGGKYYEVQKLGGMDNRQEVVLRRAAEHISGRPVYRQLRSFWIDRDRLADPTAPRREDASVVIERQLVAMTVETRGYLELSHRSNIAEARTVTVPGLAPRKYIEKEVLRIELFGATPEIRGSIALLLNELFVTIFPDGHSFIVALTADEPRAFGELLPEFHAAQGDEGIYIVEDSLVDLGLTVAVERHWERLLAIITDYLAWVASPSPESAEEFEATVLFPGDTAEDVADRERRIAEAERRGSYESPARPSWWRRVLRRVTSWFKRKPRTELENADEIDTKDSNAVETEASFTLPDANDLTEVAELPSPTGLPESTEVQKASWPAGMLDEMIDIKEFVEVHNLETDSEPKLAPEFDSEPDRELIGEPEPELEPNPTPEPALEPGGAPEEESETDAK